MSSDAYLGAHMPHAACAHETGGGHARPPAREIQALDLAGRSAPR